MLACMIDHPREKIGDKVEELWGDFYFYCWKKLFLATVLKVIRALANIKEYLGLSWEVLPVVR